jgi:uncharacterized membrane-anchored protein YitT (DUF2179 family)
MRPVNSSSWIRKYFVILLLGLFVVVLLVNKFVNDREIKRKGRYVLAVITSSDFSSRGTTYKYDYWFGSLKFNDSSIALGWRKRQGDFILLKIVPDDPTIYSVSSLNVPYCVTTDMQPSNGWNEPLKDTCRYN